MAALLLLLTRVVPCAHVGYMRHLHHQNMRYAVVIMFHSVTQGQHYARLSELQQALCWMLTM